MGATTLAVAVFIGCGKDPVEPPIESLYAPEAWAGVWEVTLTSRECGSDSILAVDIIPDSVCTGESLVEFLGLSEDDVQLSCVGSWTDSDLTATCTGTSNALGCDLDVAGAINASLSASNFTGAVRISLRFKCDDLSDDCIDAELNAVRLGPEPADCEQPANSLMDVIAPRLGHQR